jgi:hypothetical protein
MFMGSKGKEKKQFFFEKKNQKTFDYWFPFRGEHSPTTRQSKDG